MYQNPKQILTIAQQVQSYIDAGIQLLLGEMLKKLKIYWILSFERIFFPFV